MRNINAASLAKINSQYGIESVIVLQIQWPNGSVYYGEKEYPQFGVEGRIISTGSIDDVVGVGQSGSSRSVSFTLSDHDGALKNYFDNVDLHKVPARILQYFDGLPFSDAFLIFDGSINTPIQWNEGTRTLEITVMSPLENREFGFSPDEAYFGLVPNSLMGSAWPIAFGTNIRVPALAINESPNILLSSGFAIVDEDLWEAELADLSKQSEAAKAQALAAYAAGVFASFTAATYINGSEHSFIGLGGVEVVDDPPDDYNSYLQYHNQSNQYYAQYTQFSNDFIKIEAEIASKSAEFLLQKGYAFKTVNILSTHAPRDTPLVVQIGSNRWNVSINGSQMVIGSRVVPPKTIAASFATFNQGDTSRSWEGRKNQEKFTWIPGGTRLKVMNLPMKYVVTLGTVQVLNVFGRQQGMFVPVPPEYLRIEQTPFITKIGQTVFATTVTTTLPLTSIEDAEGQQIWQDDTIYVDVVSGVPGRLVDILTYAIQNFTNLGIDSASFAQARLYTDSIPMNHVVRDRRDTLEYMEAIAFQGKCALWINDNIVYIRYLPIEPAPVDTITVANILEDSLSIFTTSTEEVVTKYVAIWKLTESQQENNEIVFRYNMEKYNYHEEQYNFFAFNDPGSVGWSARYWSVRKGTMYKKIKFKTDLTKLNLEAFDAVLIDIVPMVSCVPVVGIIESATYSSDAKEIDFVVWIPVRLGELCPSPFGYPASELALYGDPSDLGIYTGNPFEKMRDPTRFMAGSLNYYIPHAFAALSPLHAGVPYPLEAGTDTAIGVDTFIFNGLMNLALPAVDLTTANDYRKYDVGTVKDVPLDDGTLAGAYFGTIIGSVEGSTSKYRIQLFGKNQVVSATQALIASDSPKIPNGTPVILIKVTGLYYFQAPVWLTPDAT
jgi:hypothetical protein